MCHHSKIHINIYCASDDTWKEFEFNSRNFNDDDYVVDTTYVNGVFYCVFSRGQLGAFSIELKKWAILVNP